eukprot:1934679-Rhodomonas_salina.1
MPNSPSGVNSPLSALACKRSSSGISSPNAFARSTAMQIRPMMMPVPNEATATPANPATLAAPRHMVSVV